MNTKFSYFKNSEHILHGAGKKVAIVGKTYRGLSDIYLADLKLRRRKYILANKLFHCVFAKLPNYLNSKFRVIETA